MKQKETRLRGGKTVMNIRVLRLLEGNRTDELLQLGAGAERPLIKALRNGNKDVRYNAASVLYTFGARAKLEGRDIFDEKTWTRINHELIGVGHTEIRVLDSVPQEHID